MTVVFRTGRGTTTFNSGDNAFLNAFKRNIDEKINEKVRKIAKDRREVITKEVNEKVNAELLKAFSFMTNNLMGLQSSTTSMVINSAITGSTGQYAKLVPKNVRHFSEVRPDSGNQIKWRPLEEKTIKQKKRNKESYFLHYGTLRRFIEKNAQSLIDRMGSVKVQLTPKSVKTGYTTTVADVSITMIPNVYPNWLPSLRTGRWADFSPDIKLERHLGIPDKLLDKLQGRGNNHRPLIEPVLSFWLLHRIPRLIDSIVSKAVK